MTSPIEERRISKSRIAPFFKWGRVADTTEIRIRSREEIAIVKRRSKSDHVLEERVPPLFAIM